MLSSIFQFWFIKIINMYGLFFQIWNIKTQETLKSFVYSLRTKLLYILHSKQNRKEKLQRKLE
jgi:hypothetical protein